MTPAKVRSCRIRKRLLMAFVCLCLAVMGFGGCGQSAPPVTTPANTTVNTYFSGPFVVTINPVGRSSATFDHSAAQIGMSGFVTSQSALVPTQVLSGSFTAVSTGFLTVSENFLTTNSGYVPQNPPMTGAWAVEIPGAGALANLLSVNNSTTPATVKAGPAAMADNTTCPNFPSQASYLYVNVPSPSSTSNDTSNYGNVGISTQGSAVTFSSTPYLVGPLASAPSTVTGACSVSTLGAITSYPLNSYGQPSNLELISIGKSGLLVSSFNATNGQSSAGAFGGGNGVIGVLEPMSSVDVSSIVSAKYNGFIYAPKNAVTETYDITQLASAFGNHAGTDPACAALQSSLSANFGQGNGAVTALPSSNTIYGGEFLSVDSLGNNSNNPGGQLGSENCDVAIDLGTEDSSIVGVFPKATVYIGSNYPPFSNSNPWNCFGTASVCAVSFPAAAVVGQVQGQTVIFVAASANSNPAAQLPNNFGGLAPQPVGIYLFQKSQ